MTLQLTQYNSAGNYIFSFAVFLFLSLRARYKNRQSVSFSVVVMDGSSKITYMWAVSINTIRVRKPILRNYFSHTNKQTWYHSYVIDLVFYLHLACLPMPCQPSDTRDLGMTPKRKFWECGDKEATANLQFPLFIAAHRMSSVEKKRGKKLFLLSIAPSLYLVNHCLMVQQKLPKKQDELNTVVGP